MVDQKMCRICMTKENLTSIFCQMDGGKISDKINFVCGISISSSDSFPKLICHQCLSSIIIASSIKKKSLDTEKIFHDIMSEDAEYIDDKDTDDEDPYLIESKVSTRNPFLVYEEKPELENQPKMNYNLSDTSTKITNLNHFNFNPELKAFVDGYIGKKPNLEIIKISDPACIKDIERVLSLNDEVNHSSHLKRPKLERQSFGVGSQSMGRKSIVPPGSSRLLNALSGQRFAGVTVNRISSPSINSNNRKSAAYRK